MTASSLRRARVAATAVLSIAAACSGGGDAPTAPPASAPVARVTVAGVTGPSDSLTVGDRRSLSVSLAGANGATLSGRRVAWTSSDATVAAVDGAGAVTALAPGQATISAESEGVRGTVLVSIRRRAIARVTVTAPDTVAVGRTVTARVTAYAADGTALTPAELTGRAAAWSSDRPTVVALTTVDATTATARGLAPGNATLSATIDGVAGSYTVIAARPTVARVAYSPTSLTVARGSAATVTATALDSDGQPVEDAEMLFAITAGSNVVRVDYSATTAGKATVRVVGSTAGAAVVFGAANGKGGSLPITVTDPTGPALRAFPTSITTTVGARARLALTLTDSGGRAQTPSGVVYRSSNAAVVAVDADGRVTTVGNGAATITVTANGFTATVPVTVAPLPATTFTIRLVPVGAVPPAVLAAAQEAANRWLRVITTELTVAQIDLEPSQCDFGTTSLHTVATGVVVYVRAAPIDGPRNTLAYAGPCVVRASTTGLPLVGALVVDSADVATLTGTGAGLGVDVLTHELGHVLGIGTLWRGNTAGGVLSQAIGADILYTGRAGADAAYRMGLTLSPSYGAPIETEGGLGTAGVHWHEKVFYGELMTGWINPSPNPLSVLSVMSLRDLGYQVTELGADITSPTTIYGGTLWPSGPASVSANRIPLGTPAAEPFQIGERLIRPKYEADARGTRPIP